MNSKKGIIAILIAAIFLCSAGSLFASYHRFATHIKAWGANTLLANGSKTESQNQYVQVYMFETDARNIELWAEKDGQKISNVVVAAPQRYYTMAYTRNLDPGESVQLWGDNGSATKTYVYGAVDFH